MRYETVIGLEVHVELATRTKMFCSCSTAFGNPPNTQCCPVCTGMPGTLPVLNQTAVKFAVAAGLALHCQVTSYNRFDRKHYFYPDLPKAYQVSQLYLPVCRDGYLEIPGEGGNRKIHIQEMHMEEDAGKLIHQEASGRTLIDYNRCGVPLLEIVSKPDFRSAEEVHTYLEKLKHILQYIGVSDCKMQEGSFRADINLSLRPFGQEALGIRTEMKNLNSLKAISRAIAEESRRQTQVLKEGKCIVQETRRWEDGKGQSVSLRSKENVQDYRYFPEPDLLPLYISDSWVSQIRTELPELPEAKKKRYLTEYDLPEYDADMLVATKPLADLFESACRISQSPKHTANWILGELRNLLNEKALCLETLRFSPEHFGRLVLLVKENKINRNAGRQLLQAIVLENAEPEAYIQQYGLAMISDTEEIASAVETVVTENPQSVLEYQNGKGKALRYLVGQVMRGMNGQADPVLVNALLKEKLK